tara:strand:+ start:388 stop:579 length:192 start_codon:yes stop_codon:yes gene_type:complete
MSKTEDSKTKHFCDKCIASFLTRKGLELHFQKQHGIYTETCPIDTAVQKITSVFRQKKQDRFA